MAGAAKEVHQDDERVSRVYELGYQISPEVKEEDVEKTVGDIRSSIEKEGGSFIAEGAPSMIKLAYPMGIKVRGKSTLHDRAYFGWIKFEAPTEAARALEVMLKSNSAVLRSIVFRTVREETRAKFKPTSIREVRRTDTLRPVLRTQEEPAVPVSEEDLEKAIEDITTE